MTAKSWAVCAVVRRRSKDRHCTNWSAYGVRHCCRGFARAKSMCAKPTKTLWGSLRRKKSLSEFVQHGERVCKRVGGRDDTEIIGRKEFFGAGGAKRGKHKEKFLSSKGIEVWIVPSTDFLHHRRALSTLSTVHLSHEERRREGRCAVGKCVPAERFNCAKPKPRPPGGEETTKIFDTKPGGAS